MDFMRMYRDLFPDDLPVLLRDPREPRDEGPARECAPGNTCPEQAWHTANCPPWQETQLEMTHEWDWQEKVWKVMER